MAASRSGNPKRTLRGILQAFKQANRASRALQQAFTSLKSAYAAGCCRIQYVLQLVSDVFRDVFRVGCSPLHLFPRQPWLLCPRRPRKLLRLTTWTTAEGRPGCRKAASAGVYSSDRNSVTHSKHITHGKPSVPKLPSTSLAWNSQAI